MRESKTLSSAHSLLLGIIIPRKPARAQIQQAQQKGVGDYAEKKQK